MIQSAINTIKNNWEICVILIIAGILRTLSFTEIPFMHDELSALIRTKYNSYGDLLEYGVKRLDTHPALIQSFLYFWTKAFGYTEWIVKLPFILMSIASVWFVYKIGFRWYNKTSGLILAILFACMQYSIMYGQIIRPYGSGLFFSLALTYYWGELIFYGQYRRKNVIGYIVFGTLCAYNHHFSLLLAALMGILGLFFATKGTRGKYIFISLVIPLLYVPHLPIFWYHLHVGGVEAWLGKPNPSFLGNFLLYLFHYSYFALSAFVVVLIAGRIFGKRNFEFHPQLLFSALIFGINYAIAYYYSKYGAAVLQTSVLIFTTPFIFLSLVGLINEQSKRFNWIATALIGTSMIVTLFVNRQHYSVFYVPTFKQLVWDADYATAHFSTTKTYIFCDELKARFYEPKLKINTGYTFIKLPDFTLSDLETELRENFDKYDHICLSTTSGLPPTYRALIQQYYPKLEWSNDYFSANAAVYSKGKSTDKILGFLELKPEGNWTGLDVKKFDVLKPKQYRYSEGDEWGPSFNLKLLKSDIWIYDYIDVYTKIKLDSLEFNPLLVISCQDKDSVFQYSTTEAKTFYWNSHDSTVTIVNSLKLIDTPYKRFSEPEFHTFVWNINKKPFTILDYKVIYRKGNPLLYSLYDAIDPRYQQ